LQDFASIYRGYQPKVQRYLSNLTGEEDARDLTQVVFHKISWSLGSFRGQSTLSTWIYRIATNTARDHAASSASKQRSLELPFDENASLDDLPQIGDPGTDRQYFRHEMNACIRGVINQLPENYRTILFLSEIEELTNMEVAETLNLSLETVKIRLQRARAALRKAMQCECSLYHDERNELMCDKKNSR
jgi:RNA polymerase sigma-70 factor, ECF subfamily